MDELTIAKLEGMQKEIIELYKQGKITEDICHHLDWAFDTIFGNNDFTTLLDDNTLNKN